MIIDSVENLKRKRDSEDISEALIARKKEESTRIRLAEMNLNESEIDILKEDISPNAETKATLLYTECGHIDHGTK